ncbi:hypothetical protein [Cohnella sp. GCM10012308]|uniref:hypothetical protein n=1 Tax=Cohnella sp. GCM10012308 TaxID=3317329 RepID=UPI00360AEC79
MNERLIGEQAEFECKKHAEDAACFIAFGVPEPIESLAGADNLHLYIYFPPMRESG